MAFLDFSIKEVEYYATKIKVSLSCWYLDDNRCQENKFWYRPSEFNIINLFTVVTNLLPEQSFILKHSVANHQKQLLQIQTKNFLISAILLNSKFNQQWIYSRNIHSIMYYVSCIMAISKFSASHWKELWHNHNLSASHSGTTQTCSWAPRPL